MVNGEELFQYSDKDEDKNAWKIKMFFDSKIEDIKVVVTGNAKVRDVGIAEIKHCWE